MMLRGVALVLGLMALPGFLWAKSFAIVLGNNVAPGTKLAPLHYADDDAVKYAELLRAADIETTLLVVPDADTAKTFGVAGKAPTRAALQQATRDVFARVRAAGGETNFYFVYSGHGDVGRGNQGRVFLHDGALSRGDLLRDVVGASPATYNHVIIDACHAYFMVKARGTGQAPSFEALLKSYLESEKISSYPNTGIVVSTTSATEVHELSVLQSGLFSYEVRSALAGAADVNGDRQISYDELGAFLAAANSGITDGKAKLAALAQAPQVSRAVPLMTLPPGAAMVTLPKQPGRVLLWDDRGLRYFDTHAAGDAVLRVLLTRNRYRLQAGDVTGSIEGTTLTLGAAQNWRNDLTGTPFEGLYGTPFGQRFFDGYRAAAPAEASVLLPRLALQVIGDAGLVQIATPVLQKGLEDLGYRLATATGATTKGNAADYAVTATIATESQGAVRDSGLTSARATLHLKVQRLDGGEVYADVADGAGLALSASKSTERAVQQAVAKALEALSARPVR